MSTTFYKKYFKDEIYHQSFWVVTGDRESLFNFLLTTFDYTVDEEFIEWIKHRIGCRFSVDNVEIIWAENIFENNYTIDHELIHKCIRTMDNCGIKITVENDEPLAYYKTYCQQMVDEWVIVLAKRIVKKSKTSKVSKKCKTK